MSIKTTKKKVSKPRKSKVEKKPRKNSLPKTRNLNTWTEAEYFSRVRSALRRVFRYFKPMQKALDNASRPSESDNKRLKKEYQCAYCHSWLPRKSVEIDHKIQAGSLKCYDDVVPFLIRLTSENVEDYQILCKPCHKIKGFEDKQKLRKNETTCKTNTKKK